MNRLLWKVLFGLGILAITTLQPTTARAQMSADLAAELSKNVDQKVIVILKNQHGVAPAGTTEDLQRSF